MESERGRKEERRERREEEEERRGEEKKSERDRQSVSHRGTGQVRIVTVRAMQAWGLSARP